MHTSKTQDASKKDLEELPIDDFIVRAIKYTVDLAILIGISRVMRVRSGDRNRLVQSVEAVAANARNDV
jgi:hypothetical protein